MEFHLHHKYITEIHLALGRSFPSANLRATRSTTVPAHKTVSIQARICLRVAVWYQLVLTVNQAYLVTSVSESTASGASALDDKTVTIEGTSVSLQRVLLATITCLHITNSIVAMIKYHIHYPIFMACTGGAVISLISYPYTV